MQEKLENGFFPLCLETPISKRGFGRALVYKVPDSRYHVLGQLEMCQFLLGPHLERGASGVWRV